MKMTQKGVRYITLLSSLSGVRLVFCMSLHISILFVILLLKILI